MVQYYKNKKTGEMIRWEPAIFRHNSILLPGRAGINHWHRMNHKAENKNNYLDASDNECSILSKKSFLPPKNQTDFNYDNISIETDEDKLNTGLKDFINILDNKTADWLHDSIIKEIHISNNIILKILHDRNEEIIQSAFIFNESRFVSGYDYDNFIQQEIYKVKLNNYNSLCKILFFTSQNETFEIIFKNIEYAGDM